MEGFSGEAEEGGEDVSGLKKSKTKSLKTRLLRRSKTADEDLAEKLSRSAGDMTFPKSPGSDEDSESSQITLGSRAMSHDSIFLADEDPSEPEPVRVTSQENVHSKIKALQTKLQLQKMHFGPPPMVLPVRGPDTVDPSDRSQDQPLQQRSNENLEKIISTQGGFNKTSQPVLPPLIPALKPTPANPLSPPSSNPWSFSPPVVPPASSTEAPLDFAAPAKPLCRLDSSAARHRMSIKPKNQRASTKKKISPLAVSQSQTPNTTMSREEPEEKRKEGEVEKAAAAAAAADEEESSLQPPAKFVKTSFISSDAALKSSLSSPQQLDRAPPEPPLPQLEPDTVEVETSKQILVEPELKTKREESFGKQTAPSEQTKSQSNTGINEVSIERVSSTAPSKTPFSRQQLSGDAQSSRGIRRPGTGSFHFTTARQQEEEQPRSGSFVLKQTEALNKTSGGAAEKNTQEKGEPKPSQARVGVFAAGRPRQDGVLGKIQWEGKEGEKSGEPESPSKYVPAVKGATQQEEVEKAEEAREVLGEDGRTAFGVKLRTTSQSLKFRSETTAHRQSKTLTQEEQMEQKEVSRKHEEGEGRSQNSIFTQKPANANPALTRLNSSPTDSTSTTTTLPAETPSVRETEALQPESQPGARTSPSEVSWMSLAMEKTRSLQQLFTSKLPKDFGGNQTAVRPQAQSVNSTEATQKEPTASPPSLTPSHTSDPANTDKKASGEVFPGRYHKDFVVTQSGVRPQGQSVSPTESTPKEPVTPQQTASSSLASHRGLDKSTEEPIQAVKPSVVAMQQRLLSPVLSHTAKEVQAASKQTKEEQPPQPSAAQTVQATPAAPQTNPWTLLSPLRATPQTQACASQSPTLPSLPAPAPQQQPAWSSQPAAGSEGVEREPSLSVRRVVWTGSANDRAVFLEKRAAWTSTPVIKGVELRKTQTDVQMSGEPPSPAKVTLLSRDANVDVTKPAESSPTRVPMRTRDEKWLRRNLSSSPSPSSSPTQPSVLQSMADSGQPSWMELAKRKSMAWSDKSMD